jgi:hypothetical protein
MAGWEGWYVGWQHSDASTHEEYIKSLRTREEIRRIKEEEEKKREESHKQRVEEQLLRWTEMTLQKRFAGDPDSDAKIADSAAKLYPENYDKIYARLTPEEKKIIACAQACQEAKPVWQCYEQDKEGMPIEDKDGNSIRKPPCVQWGHKSTFRPFGESIQSE